MASTEKEILENASNKLEYHVKMYAETYRWLNDDERRKDAPVLIANAVEESHAVHARTLIEFLGKKNRDTDVNAIDFYPPESVRNYQPLEDDFLTEWKRKIERRLLHQTTKESTEFISDWTWPIDMIAEKLQQYLTEFFSDASASKLRDVDRTQCLNHLNRLHAKTP
jgi:hypothetical protein